MFSERSQVSGGSNPPPSANERRIEIIDIVDTGKNSRIKITEERGTRAMVSRQPLNAIGTHKSREAAVGKAPKGVGLTFRLKDPAEYSCQTGNGEGEEP